MIGLFKLIKVYLILLVWLWFFRGYIPIKHRLASSSSSLDEVSSRSSQVLMRPFFSLDFSTSSCPKTSSVLDIHTWSVQTSCVHSIIWSFCLCLSFPWTPFCKSSSIWIYFCSSIFYGSFVRWKQAHLHETYPQILH